MVRRLVGFHEYGHALDHLDKLVGMCGEKDIVAIDQILADRGEFDLFVAMPEGFRQGSTAAEAEERGDDRQNGLAWVIALARVEFGAMVTGFTAHPDPYQWVQPDTLAFAETMQLLLEGVEGHFRALRDTSKTDAQVKKIYGDDQVKSKLAKARRVRIARVMLHALGKVDPTMYTERQAGDLTSVQRELTRQQTELHKSLKVMLSAMTSIDSSVSSSTREFVNACGIQLQAERNELAAGTATVTNFPVDRQ